VYNRIVTHNDLDGAFSAAICSAIHGVERIVFTGPNVVSRSGFSVTKSDIVCDLPYPGECGLWFDHHAGNLEELKRLGKDVSSLPGAFAPEKSCARVIYNCYQEDYEFPDFYEATVAEVDIIDSFDYANIEAWRKETPARVINDSIKARFKSLHDEEEYLRVLIDRLSERPMAEVAKDADIRANFEDYLKEEERMLDIIRKTSFFHPLDANREIAIIDLTGFSKRVNVVRNLAQIIHPGIRGVFMIQNLFDLGVKTTNFSISGSLTIRSNGAPKDIGEIMRVLNIGDGHSGAGSGHVYCPSKADMEKKKTETVEKVVALWRAQQG
jgi:oligoribonuclease NrnB/cAMP/cGMP phosphodiesterase (DHH superfamily)